MGFYQIAEQFECVVVLSTRPILYMPDQLLKKKLRNLNMGTFLVFSHAGQLESHVFVLVNFFLIKTYSKNYKRST